MVKKKEKKKTKRNLDLISTLLCRGIKRDRKEITVKNKQIIKSFQCII